MSITRDAYVARQVGPRQVGGRYSDCSGQDYTVVAIGDGTELACSAGWSIAVRYADGHTATHCTGWDPRRDRVIS